jgi:hypothetical protein
MIMDSIGWRGQTSILPLSQQLMFIMPHTFAIDFSTSDGFRTSAQLIVFLIFGQNLD